MISEEVIPLNAFKHHIRSKVCDTRLKYRRGRRETSVKVLTIADESQYLLIHNVPDIKMDLKQELLKLCQRFGEIEKLCPTDYPNCEDFTKVYLIKYKKFVNAVMAKKGLDDKHFFGSILHVCYAPELETINETKDKLNARKTYVNHKLSQINVNTNANYEKTQKSQQQSCGTNLDVNNPEMSLRKESIGLQSTSRGIKTETKDDAIEKLEVLKRNISEVESYEDSNVNTNACSSTLVLSVGKTRPKIRWRQSIVKSANV